MNNEKEINKGNNEDNVFLQNNPALNDIEINKGNNEDNVFLQYNPALNDIEIPKLKKIDNAELDDMLQKSQEPEQKSDESSKGI